MIVIFRAFHVDIWVAFVGFFLPLVVAFASRNAARFAFLETQDCIGHNPSSSFLRRVTALWVTAVTVVTAVLGCPLPIAVTVTLIPCMTVTALAREYPKNTVIIDMTVMQGVRVTVAAVGRGYPKTAVTTVTAVTPKDGHPPKERRNPPMPYAILRFQKRKAGGVAACERHNERKKEAYKSNPDIDMERSKNNYHLIAPPKYTYKKEINRMVAEAGCRTRKDSVMMVETLITASPEFMNQLPPEEQKAYFQTALDFISERVGKQNILSAVVHMDERTPHMHLCFVPITPDNKLSAKAILGNQKSLSEWQTAYHERMSSRWNQLERGQSSMETKRKHVPTWLYKLGGRLDKQYEEIVSALSDINAFNAGKKRDKALDLLSAWLPDVEKFSKEIGKQQAYIDSLKERIGQESDYAGRMRDEKYEQELKVQKANQKIFELQRTNEQMGRLLSKIPPEVLEELQRTGRNKSRER